MATQEERFEPIRRAIESLKQRSKNRRGPWIITDEDLEAMFPAISETTPELEIRES